jgi:hypothetical protein
MFLLTAVNHIVSIINVNIYQYNDDDDDDDDDSNNDDNDWMTSLL